MKKEQVIKDYMTFRMIECKNKSALINYERYIRSFLEKSKDDLSDVNENYLTNHVNNISNKFSQKSLNNIKPLLKNFIKWKYPDYSIKFRNLDRICKTKRAASSYTPQQMLKEKDIKKIAEAENDLFWKTFWLIFFYGGFRAVDVIRLKWDMFTFEKDGMTIIKSFIGKNQKTFYKSLPKEVTPIIKRWKDVNSSEWVFPSPQGNYPIHQKTPNKRLERVSKKVLGYSINPYTIRHSLATIKYNQDGLSGDDVANQLGHSKDMKETYTHLDEGKLIERAKKVWTDKKEMPKKEREEFQKQLNQLRQVVDNQQKTINEQNKELKRSLKRMDKVLDLEKQIQQISSNIK